MKEILYGSLSSINDFGQKILENVWIQRESVESIKRSNEIAIRVRKCEICLESRVLIDYIAK